MEIQIFGIKKSADTRKALRFFSERRVKTHFVDLAERAASPGELKRYVQKFGIAALIDQESKRYAELGLAHARVSDERWLKQLVAEPLLLKMPLVRFGHRLTIGTAEREHQQGDHEQADQGEHVVADFQQTVADVAQEDARCALCGLGHALPPSRLGHVHPFLCRTTRATASHARPRPAANDGGDNRLPLAKGALHGSRSGGSAEAFTQIGAQRVARVNPGNACFDGL